MYNPWFNIYTYSDRYNITYRTAAGPAAWVPWLNDSDHLYLEQGGNRKQNQHIHIILLSGWNWHAGKDFHFGICQMNEIH